jgi:hypothetical protein
MIGKVLENEGFLQEGLRIKRLSRPNVKPLPASDQLLQPIRPQSNVNPKRSGQWPKTTGKTLADGFKLPICADAVDFAENHGRLN